MGARVRPDDPSELDFERTEALIGALLDRDSPVMAKLSDDASNGEAIASYVASLAPDDKDLLLRDYLLLEVMLDEVDGPGVANAVNTFLPPLAAEPSA
jgi:hypothetical protein